MRNNQNNHLVADNPFAAQYPQTPGLFDHDLVGHPLLSIDALADASTRMNPAHVEIRSADAGPGGAFVQLPASPAAAIRSIEDSGVWAMLRFAEQLPEYRKLLDQTLANFADVVEAKTGAMRDMRAFIFISSDAMITPFHFDAEYNILFQISGQKSFCTFPANPPFLVAESHERMHASGDNLLPWDHVFMPHATDHRLAPGKAIFVPYKVPHLVNVICGPSISLSLTWKSDWSLAQDDAHRFNAAMRRIGLRPRDVPGWPERVPAKTLGSKIFRKVGLV